jgi:DNA-binding MarR family transcriptional regulator
VVGILPCVVKSAIPTAREPAVGREPQEPGEPPASTHPADSRDETAWLDARQDEVWRLLLSVHAKLLARLDDELRRGHELNLADYEVLVALSESEGALRMTELAERVMLSPSGLTRRVDRLVGRGLVNRRACPSDGRGSLAAVTAEGWDKLRQAAPTHVAGVRRYLLDSVTPAGIEQLASGLRSVDEALEGTGRRDGSEGHGPRGRTAPSPGEAVTPARP